VFIDAPEIYLELRIKTAVSVALLISLLVGCKRQDGPSLSETLSWMNQTYNPYKDGFGGHGSYVNGKLYYHETLTTAGCQITRITTSSSHGDHGLQEVFNLRDIDPQSIRTVDNPNPGTVVEVQFAARNNAEHG
jgi:hypothetical protein